MFCISFMGTTVFKKNLIFFKSSTNCFPQNWSRFKGTLVHDSILTHRYGQLKSPSTPPKGPVNRARN